MILLNSCVLTGLFENKQQHFGLRITISFVKNVPKNHPEAYIPNSTNASTHNEMQELDITFS